VILLARHGQTDHNIPPARVMGRLDIPLNERGREQARALARAVEGEGLASVWASSLSRAAETAAIVGEAAGLEPRLDERFAESHRGDWEGRLLRDIEREEPAAWAAWRRAGASFGFPGGESLAEHMRRVSAALDDVRAGPLPALVVCHGGSIRAAFAAKDERGLDAFHELEVPNAALLRLE
jgi:broad specificity phosphatase PhoE